MADTTKITDVFQLTDYDLQESARKSRGWFETEVLKLRRQQRLLVPQKVLRGNPSMLTPKILPGKMYLFMYDPKTKDELPYYDRFPLVLPWKKTEDGFIGLNLHYLPLLWRFRLLDRLSRFRTNTRMDETTRIRYSWEMIDGVSRYAAAKPCVKRYLMSHLRSQFRLIPASDWANAMMLPVEQFRGAAKQAVWQDSIRKMRK